MIQNTKQRLSKYNHLMALPTQIRSMKNEIQVEYIVR